MKVSDKLRELAETIQSLSNNVSDYSRGDIIDELELLHAEIINLAEGLENPDTFQGQIVTASLINAAYAPSTSGKSACIRGNIFNDTRGRFKDGTLVYSSKIDTVHNDGKNYFVKTLNSLYKIESWKND